MIAIASMPKIDVSLLAKCIYQSSYWLL